MPSARRRWRPPRRTAAPGEKHEQQSGEPTSAGRDPSTPGLLITLSHPPVVRVIAYDFDSQRRAEPIAKLIASIIELLQAAA